MANELDAPLGLTLTAALTEDATTLLFACLPRSLSVPNKHIFLFILHPDIQFDKYKVLVSNSRKISGTTIKCREACKPKTNQVANLKKGSELMQPYIQKFSPEIFQVSPLTSLFEVQNNKKTHFQTMNAILSH